MKRLIFITIMSLVAFAATGQGRYYTLGECGMDRLKYIELNYEDNSERYIGQTIEFFIGECSLTLEDFFPVTHMMSEKGPSALDGKIIGIFFDFYSGDYEYSVGIHFAPPYTKSRDDLRAIEDTDTIEPWQNKFYNFFKDYTIEEMGVIKSKYDYNKKSYMPIYDYRRP